MNEEKKRCWWSVKEVSRVVSKCMCLIVTEAGTGSIVKIIDDSFRFAQYLSTKSFGDKAVDALFQDPSITSKLEAEPERTRSTRLRKCHPFK
jgi:hypothetical protein